MNSCDDDKGTEIQCNLADLNLEAVIDQLYKSHNRQFDPLRQQISSQPGNFLWDFADLLLTRATETPEPTKEEAILVAIGMPLLTHLEWNLRRRVEPKQRMMALRIIQAVALRATDRIDSIIVFQDLKYCERFTEPGHFRSAIKQAIKDIRRQHLRRFKLKPARHSGRKRTSGESNTMGMSATTIGSNQSPVEQPLKSNKATSVTLSSNACSANR